MATERVCELCSTANFREVQVQAWPKADAPLTLHVCENCALIYCWRKPIERPSATSTFDKPMTFAQGWPQQR